MEKRKGNLHTLKPFKKGGDDRINKKGRPKKLPDLTELLADVLGDENKGINAAKAILMSLRQKAVKGDVRAAEALLDRAYGKPKQDIQHSGFDKVTIKIGGKKTE